MSRSPRKPRPAGRRPVRRPPLPPGARGSVGVVYGINAVEAALRAGRRTLLALHVKAGTPSPAHERLLALAAQRGLGAQQHGGAELDALASGGHHQGVVLACGALPVLDDHAALALGAWQADAAAAPPLLLALDQVEDPRNLGAVARSAAAFGAAGLVLPRDHSAPLSAVASSASAGALERLPVYLVPNLARFLEQAKAHGFWSAGAATEGGEPVSGYRHDRPLVLVLGNEGRGLRPLVARSCDLLLTIPLPGAGAGPEASLDSLNVSAAAAVLLYCLLGAR